MKNRKSNFELLRIIAMLMIISFHLVYKSGYEFKSLTLNSYIIKLFWFGGELGVNLFILITGYFMVKGKFSWKKIVLLFFEIIFYNSIEAILAQILGVGSIFRIFYSPYWFTRMYIMLYLISPFINKLINIIEKKEYQKLLIICISIWSILPTFLGLTKNSTENLDFYSRMIWFTIVYLIGGYIRLYGIKIFQEKKSSIVTVTMLVLLVLSIPIIQYIKILIPRLSSLEVAYLWTPNNIIMLVLSLSIFCLFEQVNIGSIKIINLLSSTTLGIYMLHDGLLRNYLWQNIFNTKEILSNNQPFPNIIIITIIIFVIGVIVDLIRQWLEKRTIIKLINNVNLHNKLKKIKENIFNKISNLL